VSIQSEEVKTRVKIKIVDNPSEDCYALLVAKKG